MPTRTEASVLGQWWEQTFVGGCCAVAQCAIRYKAGSLFSLAAQLCLGPASAAAEAPTLAGSTVFKPMRPRNVYSMQAHNATTPTCGVWGVGSRRE